jgi:hypothetical protein
MFTVKSGYISDEFMQWMWADLLIGEARDPGSVPKRAIRALSELEPDEARCFIGLCRVSCLSENGDLMVPLVIKTDDEFYQKLGITEPFLRSLEDQGLVQLRRVDTLNFSGKETCELWFTFGIQAFNLPRGYKSEFEGFVLGRRVFLGEVAWTELGKCLGKTCQFDTEPSLPGYLRKMWKAMDDKVQKYLDSEEHWPEVPYDRASVEAITRAEEDADALW